MDIISFVLGYNKGKATGGSSGGGGGSLPAGVYFSPSPIKAPTNYRHKRFMFNGELYAGCGSVAGAGYMNTIKKWDGSAWADVISVDSSTHQLDSSDFKVAELNGKAHIFSGQEHSIFDGTSITKAAGFSGLGTTYPAIWQGVLYIIRSEHGEFYQWDEESESWVEILSTSNADELFVVNNQLFAKGYDSGNRMYQYENGEFVQKSTGTISSGNTLFLKGNKRYAYWSGVLFCYDFDTNTETRMAFQNGTFYPTQNAEDISLIMTTNSSNSYYPCFDVTIIEATE